MMLVRAAGAPAPSNRVEHLIEEAKRHVARRTSSEEAREQMLSLTSTELESLASQLGLLDDLPEGWTFACTSPGGEGTGAGMGAQESAQATATATAPPEAAPFEVDVGADGWNDAQQDKPGKPQEVTSPGWHAGTYLQSFLTDSPTADDPTLPGTPRGSDAAQVDPAAAGPATLDRGRGPTAMEGGPGGPAPCSAAPRSTWHVPKLPPSLPPVHARRTSHNSQTETDVESEDTDPESECELMDGECSASRCRAKRPSAAMAPVCGLIDETRTTGPDADADASTAAPGLDCGKHVAYLVRSLSLEDDGDDAQARRASASAALSPAGAAAADGHAGLFLRETSVSLDRGSKRRRHTLAGRPHRTLSEDQATSRALPSVPALKMAWSLPQLPVAGRDTPPAPTLQSLRSAPPTTDAASLPFSPWPPSMLPFMAQLQSHPLFTTYPRFACATGAGTMPTALPKLDEDGAASSATTAASSMCTDDEDGGPVDHAPRGGDGHHPGDGLVEPLAPADERGASVRAVRPRKPRVLCRKKKARTCSHANAVFHRRGRKRDTLHCPECDAMVSTCTLCGLRMAESKFKGTICETCVSGGSHGTL